MLLYKYYLRHPRQLLSLGDTGGAHDFIDFRPRDLAYARFTYVPTVMHPVTHVLVHYDRYVLLYELEEYQRQAGIALACL